MRKALVRSALVVAMAVAMAVGAAAGANAGATPGAGPQSPQQQLTKAKVDDDLGDHEAAAAAFAELAANPSAPSSVRAEALIRLGAARKAAGDAKESVAAFTRAFREFGGDEGAVRMLIHTVGGVIPDRDRWTRAWQAVQLGVDVTDAEPPSAFIRWPGAPWAPRKLLDPAEDKVVRFVRPAGPLYSGTPISVDFKDGDLGDIFRLFADVTGLNVVVNPGIHGTVTFRVDHLPWDDVLDRMLSSLGLAFSLKGPVLQIAEARALGPASQRFTGKPVDLDFKDVEIADAFRKVVEAERGGAPPGFSPTGGDLRVEVDSGISGRVTLHLVQVPWDQAFDLMARVNGLRWRRDGNVLFVELPAAVEGR